MTTKEKIGFGLTAILGIALIVFIFLFIRNKNALDISDNNLKATKDSLHTYVMKNGELMYEKQGYILKIGELEENIGITKKEAKEIEKQLKSALATISKLKAEVRVDTIHTTDSVYITSDSVYHNSFKYNDEWLSLGGESTFSLNPFQSHTTIHSILMDVPLKVGTTEDNKWFAVSDNPNVVFTSVEGANVSKANQKNWSISIQFGIGVVGGVGLVGTQFSNISTSNTGAGWFVGGGGFIGIGIARKLVEF